MHARPFIISIHWKTANKCRHLCVEHCCGSNNPQDSSREGGEGKEREREEGRDEIQYDRAVAVGGLCEGRRHSKS